MSTVFDFNARKIDGSTANLSHWKGQVLLIVNTASECGFTPQLAGLEKLQKELGEKGFSVLAFPCNQFGSQEPGDAQQIEQFCTTRYQTSFPLFEKIEVNGAGAHPLYQFLKEEAPGILGSKAIKWNFTKFLVGRDGKVIKRYAPKTTPESVRSDVEALLNQSN